MAEESPQSYRQCAIARLARAEGMYRALNQDALPTAFCELAQVSSLIWDAVIDTIATVHMTNGGIPSGNSPELRGYTKAEFPEIYRNWGGPARLHNFQHRPYQPINEFDEACRTTARLLTQLNSHLPESMRLPVDSFAWLS